MERETVIANVRGELDFTEEAQSWLRKEAAGTWIAEGDPFLVEFSGTWRQAFAGVLDENVQAYFQELGLQGELPRTRIGDWHRGSFVIEAYVVLAISIPAAYALLKGLSELPKIADGLEDLKTRLSKEFRERSERAARQSIIDTMRRSENVPSIPPPPNLPRRLLTASVSIDARPLRALYPEQPLTHSVHLAVSLTHDSCTVENLGTEPLRNLRLGLFVNDSEQNHWNYGDAFSASVNLLSSRQTVSKDLAEFHDSGGASLSISVSKDQYVDCWVQDEHGIHLFNFLLRG